MLRSTFQEAIYHLGRAIEMADKAGDNAPGTVPSSGSVNQRGRVAAAQAEAADQLPCKHEMGARRA